MMSTEMHVRLVGFFESAADVSDAAASSGQSWETAAVRYLERGGLVVVGMSGVKDLLKPDDESVCQYTLRTDGVWVWPGELAYYLKTYHVMLPAEFVSHMTSNDWEIPDLEIETLKAVDRGLNKYFGGPSSHA